MQKAIIVGVANGGGERNVELLNQQLAKGWTVVRTEPFIPSIGGESNSYTLGSTLVILEK